MAELQGKTVVFTYNIKNKNYYVRNIEFIED